MLSGYRFYGERVVGSLRAALGSSESPCERANRHQDGGFTVETVTVTVPIEGMPARSVRLRSTKRLADLRGKTRRNRPS